jgi:hypothetical protein
VGPGPGGPWTGWTMDGWTRTGLEPGAGGTRTERDQDWMGQDWMGQDWLELGLGGTFARWDLDWTTVGQGLMDQNLEGTRTRLV